jgi:hypothetical protein
VVQNFKEELEAVKNEVIDNFTDRANLEKYMTHLIKQ